MGAGVKARHQNFSFVHGSHHYTTLGPTHMEKNKSQACFETIERGKEVETIIKFSTTDIGNKDEKLFEELRESKIIDIEYDSNDDDEIEIKVKLRITVHRPQLFSKKTPKELSKGDTKGQVTSDKEEECKEEATDTS